MNRIAVVAAALALASCAPGAQYMKPVDPLEPDHTPRAEQSPAPKPGLEELRRLVREMQLQDPESDADKLRLALLELAADDPAEAARLLAGMRDASDPLRACLESYVSRRGFALDRIALAKNVSGFRRYEPGSRDCRPSDTAVVYVEPRGFSLKAEGGQHRLHLSYAWKLFDDRGRELRVPAWEGVDPRDREDRVAFLGPVAEFYQFFRLRLPSNLAAGDYRIQVSVTDEVARATATGSVDLTILAVSR